MKKIQYTLAILLISAVTMLQAQSNTYMTYSMGFGMGDLGNFISKTSFRGAAIDYRKLVQPNVGVGFNLGWNVFYEDKDFDTYTSGTETLSGRQFRYSNHIPMLLNADYYLNPGEKVSPFVGLGTGVMYSRRNTDMNLYTLQEEAWNFTLQPEIGVQFNSSISSATTIMLKYYYGFAAGELDEPQSYLALNVGFVFRQP
ncbi:MAG TPA: outer membrane beta-barrel protein [Saprospiraceae bacterium]|nr:outer membrane beta-barrel protein [Saprospiraceae bacterium]